MHPTFRRQRKPKRVLVLGSGALQIGQGGEFDYSGSQAIKALKEEGVFTVLVNPNIATVQTNEGLADRVYLLPVSLETVANIIEREKIDGLLLSFGGQTALNCGLELHSSGTLEKFGVRVLGTPIEAIRDTEDRQIFATRARLAGATVARSSGCSSPDQAMNTALELGLPVMLRAGFALGGKGSGIARTKGELESLVHRAFTGGASQVLIEECLFGWKEVEYEIVRDAQDNCIAVCNMENLDPVGIHTGESIVVAPSQTLDDHEYHLLRSVAFRLVREFKIVGECNVQFAVDPLSREYRVIEINARLSRSSALASKATGYPLAYVAAKLALGYSLPEIPNDVTKKTTAFFEPALDYLVCKIPRWDIAKFPGASPTVGTEMKSVGEIMAIGRSFPEVIQRGLRMLDIGVDGLDSRAFPPEQTEDALRNPTVHRLFHLAAGLREGLSIETIAELTSVDPWFLHQIARIVEFERKLETATLPVEKELLLDAKRLGFSDVAIARLLQCEFSEVSNRRAQLNIRPGFPKIDTTAAEFPAETNYLYSSYWAWGSELSPKTRPRLLVLGSGPYRVGSSVEFDWCCVQAVRTARELGYETVVLNCNPETVSTDFDMCDMLVFDEISLELILDLVAHLQPDFVVVNMGGQVPNGLAIPLHRAGVRLLGTSAESIDVAEDRQKFGDLLDRLGIDQPKWARITEGDSALDTVANLGGFPVLVRPSYVLSGAAMSVAREEAGLTRILARAHVASRTKPVVISKFEERAKEIELDAVADGGLLVLWAVSEHIEDAGVHSGDATVVLPPQEVPISIVRKAKKIADAIAFELKISGIFNVQFLAKHGTVRVIECNLRASRGIPFISKVTGQDYVAEGMRRMLGVRKPIVNRFLDLDYVGVKSPQFSFSRIKGADPLVGVEMMSTGEVACFGDDRNQALLSALLASGFKIPRIGVLLSLGPLTDKYAFVEEARILLNHLGLKIYATEGTAEALQSVDIPCERLSKATGTNSAVAAIEAGVVDFVVNIPREYDIDGRPDGYAIRRAAVERGLPLVTDIGLARAIVEALRQYPEGPKSVVTQGEFLKKTEALLR